jgi:hypothetical protein
MTAYIMYNPNNMPASAYLPNDQRLVYNNDVNGNKIRNTIQGNVNTFIIRLFKSGWVWNKNERGI